MTVLTLAAVAMAGVALTGASANAANLYTSGTKTWNTTTADWGTVHGGPYNTATWSDWDSAFIEGASHTVTLGEDINLAGLTFYDNGPADLKQPNQSDFVVQGRTLNFSAGAEIKAHLTYTTQGGSSVTIKSAITGSPDAGISDNNHHLYFAPDSGSQQLGTVSVPYDAAMWDKGQLHLAGSTTGNTVDEIIYQTSPNNRWGAVHKEGSSTWTVGNVDVGTVNINGGTLVANGTMVYRYGGINVNAGGQLDYNNAGAVNNGFKLNGGSLDNSSGAPIATSTYNPTQNWTGNGFTFVGSNDLDLGTGAVTLSGSPTVTISAGTLTVDGVISDGTTPYGLTKAGAGTLTLGGANTYNGSTTVSAGTLSISQPYLNDDSIVSVAAGGAKLDLNHAATDDVFLLMLGGSPAAAGTWGSTSSAAANQDDTYFSGTGIINNAGGVYTDGRFYWDGPTVGGTGDGVSDGGNGIWSTTNANWDKGFTAREAWGNGTSKKAIFAGSSAGEVTLGSDITLEEMVIEQASTYRIGTTSATKTLTFTGAKTIAIDQQSATFRAGIAGKPTINSEGRVDHNSTLLLAPTADVTMEIGTLNVIRSNPARNTRVDLAGDSVGNSIDAITWTNGGQQLTLTKKGSGTWTLNGGYDDGPNGDARFVIDEGTLILNGTFNPSHVFEVQDGGILGGTATVSTRGGSSVGLKAGGAIAPGTSIGTLTVEDTLIWDSNDTTAGMVFDLSPSDSTSDLLDITGAFTKGTGTSFLFDFIGGKGGQTYTLVNFGSTDFLPSDFGVASGIDGTFAFGQNSLQFTTPGGPAGEIPEPATMAMLGLAVCGLGGYVRKRRRG